MRTNPTQLSDKLAQAGTPACEPNLFVLPFASKMVIWAMRKRLHSIYDGQQDDGHVVQVFHTASWGDLYASLLSATQALIVAARARPLPLHAVACPVLEDYEARWLNALTYLQSDCPKQAALSLSQIMHSLGVRQAFPHLHSIAEKLLRENLRFRLVRTNAPDTERRYISTPPAGERQGVH